MRGLVIACGLLALVASAPFVRAESDPRFQPMEQFVVVPAYPGQSGVPSTGPREPLVPIELDRRAGDEGFVQARCAGLVTAAEIRGHHEGFNPLTGTSPERGEPLKWAFGVDLGRSFPMVGASEVYAYTADYLGQFGTLTTRQTFLDGHVYQRDKGRCLLLLKYY